jgi:hypothetical protein
MTAKTERGAAWQYRALLALFALALTARVTYTIDAVRYMGHRYPAPPAALGSQRG